MKKIWAKVSAVALVGAMAVNAFIPSAMALDIDPAAFSSEATSASTTEAFTVESNVLDFGRVVELDRSYTKQIVVKNDTDKEAAFYFNTCKWRSILFNMRKGKPYDYLIFKQIKSEIKGE